MRNVEIAVISDLHIGTFGCRAKELSNYLKSINPKILVLNGDVIDIWNFKKRRLTALQLEVVQDILTKINTGTSIYYVIGNHDESLLPFKGFSLPGFQLLDELSLTVNGKKILFAHGHTFDPSVNYFPLVAKLGGVLYDGIIRIDYLLNKARNFFGLKPIRFSKYVKDSSKSVLKFINDFKAESIETAMRHGFDYVVCGHIHQPENVNIENEKGSIRYLNSGDWVENMTSLEYVNGDWNIYHHATKAQENKRNIVLVPSRKLQTA